MTIALYVLCVFCGVWAVSFAVDLYAEHRRRRRSLGPLFRGWRDEDTSARLLSAGNVIDLGARRRARAGPTGFTVEFITGVPMAVADDQQELR